MSKAMAVGMIDKKWEAEDDLRTLMRAEEIKCDSKRLKAAREMLKAKKEELKDVEFEISAEDRRSDLRKRRG